MFVHFAGVAPLSFYFMNGFLNFNIVFLMALVALPFVVSVRVLIHFQRFFLLCPLPEVMERLSFQVAASRLCRVSNRGTNSRAQIENKIRVLFVLHQIVASVQKSIKFFDLRSASLTNTAGIPAWLCMSSMYIWFLIFFTRPHKVSSYTLQ